MFSAPFSKHAQFIFTSQEDIRKKTNGDAPVADDAEAGENIDSAEIEAEDEKAEVFLHLIQDCSIFHIAGREASCVLKCPFININIPIHFCSLQNPLLLPSQHTYFCSL